MIYKSRKAKLTELKKIQLQCMLLSFGVNDVSGTREALQNRIIENWKFKYRLKPLLKSVATFLVGIIFTVIIGEYVNFPFYVRHDKQFAEDMLEWDKKDERIRNVYRLSNSILNNLYPYGYKIFATNSNVVLEHDSIFSSIMSSYLDGTVMFDYERNKVMFDFNENVVNRKANSIAYDNRFKYEMNIPSTGGYHQISGYAHQDKVLFFTLLDDAKNDEIYVLGYRKIN